MMEKTMFKNLRIQNFKGWQDTGLIKMAPITLFFGVNSSGKSSIGQFLMMLKQTVESSDRKAVFYPGGKNSAVQLGSFKDMVFQRELQNKIIFEYQWQLPERIRLKNQLGGGRFSGNLLLFNAKVGLRDEDQNSLVVDLLNYSLFEEKNNKSKKIFSIGMERVPEKSEFTVFSKGYELRRKKGRAWSPGVPIRFYGFPEEVVAYYQNADFVQELNFWHEKLFKKIFYLGPLRTRPERLYFWSGIEPDSVGYSGENTIAALLAARGRKIGLVKPNARRASPVKPFEEIIALKLKEMGLIKDFNVRPISEQRQEYEVKIAINDIKYMVDLPDVGFGVSQVLPVLVQCFYAPPGSIIIMEQPEIHLHPAAQSALADVMIDVIKSKENGKARNIQLIIETHSEHFLRRLQRRIAEDVISKDQVSAYFADITTIPPKLEELQIDSYGNIRNWPKNFFGDEMGDITSQAKAAMRKKLGQKQ